MTNQGIVTDGAGGTPARRLGRAMIRTALDWSAFVIGYEVLSQGRSSTRVSRWGALVRPFFRAFPSADNQVVRFFGASQYGHALRAALDSVAVPARVLDLGCGSGFTSITIHQHFPDAEIIGVDISPEQVKAAQKNAQDAGVEATFEVADIATLRFETSSFDLVIQQNGFTDMTQFMRVLRPGQTGLLVYTFGGPWVDMLQENIARELRSHGAEKVTFHRTFPGIYVRIVKARAA